MTALIILSSTDAEIRWNAFRLGNLMLGEGDDVTIFLNGPAVKYAEADAGLDIAGQAKLFALSEGVLVA